MTTLNKTIDKPVIEDVYEILDKAQSDNEKIPALRVIRATIGRSSFSTISEAVKQWRLDWLHPNETATTTPFIVSFKWFCAIEYTFVSLPVNET